RIYPLFAFFLAAYFIATQFISALHLPGSKYNFYFEHQSYLWLHITNFLREGAHFPEGELFHLWSLAIEEQFYVVMPLLFIFIKTFFDRFSRVFLVVLCGAIVSAFIYKLLFVNYS